MNTKMYFICILQLLIIFLRRETTTIEHTEGVIMTAGLKKQTLIVANVILSSVKFNQLSDLV